MSFLKKTVCAAVAAALSCTMVALPAFADGGMYRVSVYGGQQGLVNGETAVVSNVAAGDIVDFSSYAVTMLDDNAADRYYVKGIRPSAYNNAALTMFADADGVLSGTATITEDSDFTVAYGIKANRTSFTVRYVDAAGNDIAPSQTFVGDVGDTPAATAPYIAGYIPQAYRITGPLSANASENVFTFQYTRLPEGYTTVVNVDGTITIITSDGGTVVVDGVPAGTDGVVTADDGTTLIDDEGNPLAAPADEITIGDNENPLASGARSDVNEGAIWGWLLPLLGACVVAAIVVFVALMLHYRRKEQQNGSTVA